MPYRVKVADLEALIKADAAKVKKLEQRSANREVFLGTVERERDDAMAKLAEANKENGKITTELGQVQAESKKVAEDLLQAQGTIEELKKQAEELKQQNEGLKKQIKELNLSSAQILAAQISGGLFLLKTDRFPPSTTFTLSPFT